METRTQKRNCNDCGLTFDAYDIEWNGAVVFSQTQCEKCAEATCKALELAEKVKTAEKEMEARKEVFEVICPLLYQDTDPTKLHRNFREVAFNWQYGARGLGLIGSVGTGKTRAAYFLLKRMVMSGYVVQATIATTFAKLCVDQFSNDRKCRTSADKAIECIYQADIWLLDDLGKLRLTERCEIEFFAVLEHRISRKLPTIWTSNTAGDTLGAKFSEEGGEAIMRRLIQFNDIVTVWEK